MKQLNYYYLLFFCFFLNCNTEKKLEKDELYLVKTLIEKKIYNSASSKIMSSELLKNNKYRKYSLSELYKIADSIMPHRKFYYTISDTLTAIDKNSFLYKAAMNNFVFFPLERTNENFLLMDFKELKIRKNLIRISSIKEIDSNYYLGKFTLSRVIFNKNYNRAIIFMHSERTLFSQPVVQFEKHNDNWVIK